MVATETLRVLVVDDEALIRWSLAEMLRRHGHLVTEATSAHTAREAMSGSASPFDVVFLDYRLPDSDDLRLLEEVRQGMPQSAVVMMTAYGTAEVVSGALERGVYRILTKPFDMHEIDALAQNAHRAMRPH